MQADVDDDPGGAEDRRLVLVELMLRIGEEALLAHDPLGVERPALREVRRAEDLAKLRRIEVRHHEVPVVPRIRLVHGRRRDTRAAVALEPLLDLRVRGVVRRVGDEEVPGQRLAERRRPVV